jgi:ATP-binding cassette, subfamily B, multidrug efflux pump
MAPIMAIGGLQKAMNNAPDLSWIIALAVFILLVVIATLFTIAELIIYRVRQNLLQNP